MSFVSFDSHVMNRATTTTFQGRGFENDRITNNRRVLLEAVPRAVVRVVAWNVVESVRIYDC